MQEMESPHPKLQRREQGIIRRQSLYTILEQTRPLYVWLIVCLPAAIVFPCLLLDYTSAFRVVNYQFPASDCYTGCSITYSLDNRFGIIPINFVQVAFMGTASNKFMGTEGRSIMGNRDPELDHNQSNDTICPDNHFLITTTVSPMVDISATTYIMRTCAPISVIGASNAINSTIGTLSGINLDVPSGYNDANCNHIQVQIDIPTYNNRSMFTPDSIETLQIVYQSPLYAGIRIFFSSICWIGVAFCLYLWIQRLANVKVNAESIDASDKLFERSKIIIPEQV